jgi:uncharacterized membrane protein (DUF4010 family)
MTIPELHAVSWAQLPSVAGSLIIGALIGLERRGTGKSVGVRTFGMVALAFTLAWWQSPQVTYGLLLLCIVFVTALNIRSFMADRSLELTTSVAMLVTALLGVLVAQGGFLVAGACAVIMTALLAWKEELGGFAKIVTVSEIRGALLLGMIGLVIYPLLPVGAVDPWGLVDLRDAWVAVLAISGIGFLNYLILRLWGARGIGWTGLLGGFVNSRAVAVELARRARGDPSRLWPFAIFGMLTANVAMVVRNTFILALFAPQTLRWGWPALGLMFLVGVVLAVVYQTHAAEQLSL